MAELYFDDLTPGTVLDLGTTAVDRDEMVAFSARFDPQPFHTDAGAAARSVFGRHVGSGWHTAALTMRLWVDHGPQVAGGLVGLGVDDLRWGPLVPGDRIRVEGEVLEVRPSRSGAPRGVVRLRIRTLNQRDEEVQHMVPTILVPSRDGGAAGRDRRDGSVSGGP